MRRMSSLCRMAGLLAQVILVKHGFISIADSAEGWRQDRQPLTSVRWVAWHWRVLRYGDV